MYICADVVLVCVPTGLAGPADVPGAALPFFGCQIQQLPNSLRFFHLLLKVVLTWSTVLNLLQYNLITNLLLLTEIC